MSNGPEFIEQIARVSVSLGPQSRKFKKPPSPPPPSSVQFGFPKSMARDGTANKFELQARRRGRRGEAVQSTQSGWIGRGGRAEGIEMQQEQIVRGMLSGTRSGLSK